MGVRRHRIKRKEAKRIAAIASERWPELADFISSARDSEFELAHAEEAQVLLVDRTPVLLLAGGEPIPAITGLEKFSIDLPKVTVDVGAVPYIAKGAHVMVPGIVSLSRDFKEGAGVAVAEEKLGSIIAVGIALMSSDEIKLSSKGRAIKNIHHVGDKLWKLYSKL